MSILCLADPIYVRVLFLSNDILGITELDDGKILTGNHYFYLMVKTCKNHGFRLRFSRENQNPWVSG